MTEFLVTVSINAKSEDHKREIIEDFKRLINEVRIEKTGNHLFVVEVDEN